MTWLVVSNVRDIKSRVLAIQYITVHHEDDLTKTAKRHKLIIALIKPSGDVSRWGRIRCIGVKGSKA